MLLIFKKKQTYYKHKSRDTQYDKIALICNRQIYHDHERQSKKTIFKGQAKGMSLQLEMPVSFDFKVGGWWSAGLGGSLDQS